MAGKSYHRDKVTGEGLNGRVILNESLAGNTGCFIKSWKSREIKSNLYNFLVYVFTRKISTFLPEVSWGVAPATKPPGFVTLGIVVARRGMRLALPVLGPVAAQALGSRGAPGPSLTQAQSTSLKSVPCAREAAGGYWCLLPPPALQEAPAQAGAGADSGSVRYRHWWLCPWLPGDINCRHWWRTRGFGFFLNLVQTVEGRGAMKNN